MQLKQIVSSLFILLIMMCSEVSAQVATDTFPQNGREELVQILKERKDKFSRYTESLNTSTGIFGLKTKHDLKHSMEILAQIIRLDNRLISVLNRQLEFKTYEKVNMSYQQNTSFQEVDQLRKNVASMESRINLMNRQEQDLRNSVRIRNALMILMLTALVILLILRRKTPENTNGNTLAETIRRNQEAG